MVETGDAHRSVAIGIGSTARVITTAAAIMVVVFCSFVLDSDPTVKMLAVGMAVAVLDRRHVVRMVLVPAVMSILAHRPGGCRAGSTGSIPDLELEGSLDDDYDEGEEPTPVPAGGPEVPAQRTEPDAEQSSPVAGRTGPPPSAS